MTTTIAQKQFKMAYSARLYANGIDPEAIASLYGSSRMYFIRLHNPEKVDFGQLMLFAAAMDESPLVLYRDYGVGMETLSEAEVRLLELLDDFINQNRQNYEQTLGKIRGFATDTNTSTGKEQTKTASLTAG